MLKSRVPAVYGPGCQSERRAVDREPSARPIPQPGYDAGTPPFEMGRSLVHRHGRRHGVPDAKWLHDGCDPARTAMLGCVQENSPPARDEHGSVEAPDVEETAE